METPHYYHAEDEASIRSGLVKAMLGYWDIKALA
jgi:hypothetical protein